MWGRFMAPLWNAISRYDRRKMRSIPNAARGGPANAYPLDVPPPLLESIFLEDPKGLEHVRIGVHVNLIKRVSPCYEVWISHLGRAL